MNVQTRVSVLFDPIVKRFALRLCLRDRLVLGLRDHRIQKRLLEKENITYDKAVQLATYMKFVDKIATKIAINCGRRLQHLQLHAWDIAEQHSPTFAANNAQAVT
ncbi:hypothetical protein J6590_105352 [Homalodisca vitripennis]|nr:hypothetical protein J6590_105352 [Homalodisca vitripennis]